MRSTGGAPAVDDRSTRARIRDAAITLFAEQGIAATSLRAVAVAAEVAPSHVVHYFRSKAGLRAACDEYVAAVLRHEQEDVVAAGPDLDPLAALRRWPSDLPLLAYLARSLVDPSEGSDALVDQLLDDAERYLAGLEATGWLRPSTAPRTRAVLLTFWSLGALTLHAQLERVLGVSLTAPDRDPGATAEYATAMIEVLGPGLFTAGAAEHFRQAFASAHGTPSHDPPSHDPPPHGTPSHDAPSSGGRSRGNGDADVPTDQER
jgi:AcrR family transcriptional regulator